MSIHSDNHGQSHTTGLAVEGPDFYLSLAPAPPLRRRSQWRKIFVREGKGEASTRPVPAPSLSARNNFYVEPLSPTFTSSPFVPPPSDTISTTKRYALLDRGFNPPSTQPSPPSSPPPLLSILSIPLPPTLPPTLPLTLPLRSSSRLRLDTSISNLRELNVEHQVEIIEPPIFHFAEEAELVQLDPPQPLPVAAITQAPSSRVSGSVGSSLESECSSGNGTGGSPILCDPGFVPSSLHGLSLPSSTSMIDPISMPDLPINALMSTAQVIACLGHHGCKDISDQLDFLSCGTYPISNGGFGDVYRGKLLDGSQVAIKTMRILVNTYETQKPLKNAARELHTWSKCQHPNVVHLIGFVEFRDQIGMVSYWMENRNLPLYLERHSDVDRCRMSTEICEGLSYLHATNIVHGDLKGLNVLISDDGRPMLTDFGNAILQESTLRFTTTTAKTSLSPRWAAPELMEQLGMHSFAADVYALGMTILETITGKVPYFDKPDHGVYIAIALKKEFPARPGLHIPSNSADGNTLWSLLISCWVHESENRPSTDHVRDIMKTITSNGLTIAQSIPIDK